MLVGYETGNPGKTVTDKKYEYGFPGEHVWMRSTPALTPILHDIVNPAVGAVATVPGKAHTLSKLGRGRGKDDPHKRPRHDADRAKSARNVKEIVSHTQFGSETAYLPVQGYGGPSIFASGPFQATAGYHKLRVPRLTRR